MRDVLAYKVSLVVDARYLIHGRRGGNGRVDHAGCVVFMPTCDTGIG